MKPRAPLPPLIAYNAPDSYLAGHEAGLNGADRTPPPGLDAKWWLSGWDVGAEPRLFDQFLRDNPV